MLSAQLLSTPQWRAIDYFAFVSDTEEARLSMRVGFVDLDDHS